MGDERIGGKVFGGLWISRVPGKIAFADQSCFCFGLLVDEKEKLYNWKYFS